MLIFSWIRMIPVGAAIAVFVMIGPGWAQVRGVYPLGMTATNSGRHSRGRFTYSNQFLFYSRSELKDANGVVTATGQNSVIMDMNNFIWVSSNKIRCAWRSNLLLRRHPSDRQQFTDFRCGWANQRRRRICRLLLSTRHPGLEDEARRLSSCITDFLHPREI